MDNKEPIKKYLVIISFTSIIITNILSFVMPINGMNVVQIAACYPNFFIPSDYTFIIWIVINLLLGAFTIYQCRSSQSSLGNETISLVRTCFIAYCVLNFIWLSSWLYDYHALSTMIIFMASICIVVLLKILYKKDLSDKDKLFIKLPFSILGGWIFYTSIINLVILTESIRWEGFGIPLTIWAILTFVCVTIHTLVNTYKNKDIAYCLTVMWGLIGTLVKYINSEDLDGVYQYVIPVLIICILSLLAIVVYVLLSKKVLHRNLY